MPHTINAKCINCGTCVTECPVEAISEGEEKYEIDGEKCIDCGDCVVVCPVDAIEEKSEDRIITERDEGMEEIKEQFENFTETEKIRFIKIIMPEIRNLLEENSEFMQEMMEMMVGKIDKDKIDTFQMLNMMKKIM